MLPLQTSRTKLVNYFFSRINIKFVNAYQRRGGKINKKKKQNCKIIALKRNHRVKNRKNEGFPRYECFQPLCAPRVKHRWCCYYCKIIGLLHIDINLSMICFLANMDHYCHPWTMIFIHGPWLSFMDHDCHPLTMIVILGPWLSSMDHEIKEFEPRLKFETRLTYRWFHLKLYSKFQDLNRRSN